ncbi:hypothetical protein OG607_27350 [Streptomyces sp. NBC_01537]|uniref:hypothetical protein n=1 Tax=Streptomyces sp. NBC_01537 TaxID=2903896 RepID=UPI003869EA44
MNSETAASAVAPILGGLLVVVTTFFATRKKVRVEVLKLEADIDKTRAEITQILASVDGPGQADDQAENLPWGWYVFGSRSECYRYKIDAVVLYRGCVSAQIYALPNAPGYGSLAQSFQAGEYLGERVEFSAALKVDGVVRAAGLFLRVDDLSRKSVEFDDMHGRDVSGTQDWEVCKVVLDVPAQGATVSFGFFLHGEGRVWMSRAAIRIVDHDVPVTGRGRDFPLHPVNLGLVEERN